MRKLWIQIRPEIRPLEDTDLCITCVFRVRLSCHYRVIPGLSHPGTRAAYFVFSSRLKCLAFKRAMAMQLMRQDARQERHEAAGLHL